MTTDEKSVGERIELGLIRVPINAISFISVHFIGLSLVWSERVIVVIDRY